MILFFFMLSISCYHSNDDRSPICMVISILKLTSQLGPSIVASLIINNTIPISTPFCTHSSDPKSDDTPVKTTLTILVFLPWKPIQSPFNSEFQNAVWSNMCYYHYGRTYYSKNLIWFDFIDFLIKTTDLSDSVYNYNSPSTAVRPGLSLAHTTGERHFFKLIFFA